MTESTMLSLTALPTDITGGLPLETSLNLIDRTRYALVHGPGVSDYRHAIELGCLKLSLAAASLDARHHLLQGALLTLTYDCHMLLKTTCVNDAEKHSAENICRQVLSFLDKQANPPLPVTVAALWCLGRILSVRDKHAEAAQVFERTAAVGRGLYGVTDAWVLEVQRLLAAAQAKAERRP